MDPRQALARSALLPFTPRPLTSALPCSASDIGGGQQPPTATDKKINAALLARLTAGADRARGRRAAIEAEYAGMDRPDERKSTNLSGVVKIVRCVPKQFPGAAHAGGRGSLAVTQPRPTERRFVVCLAGPNPAR